MDNYMEKKTKQKKYASPFIRIVILGDEMFTDNILESGGGREGGGETARFRRDDEEDW